MKGSWFWAAGALVLFAACQNETKDTNYEELILGRWELIEALRDGKPTETLTGIYFEFKPEGRVVSNLAGQEEESKFELEGKNIGQKGGQIAVNYQIEELNDSLLVLTFSLRQVNFRLKLDRVVSTTESGQ